jgi:hypothetical protein
LYIRTQSSKQNGIVYLFKKNKVTFFPRSWLFMAARDGAYDIRVAGTAEENDLWQTSLWPELNADLAGQLR